MTEIPFAKLHGDQNDFLLSWAREAPRRNLPEIARRICARTTGIGADGWMLVWHEGDCCRDAACDNGSDEIRVASPRSVGDSDFRGTLRTRLFNSDGTEPEMSGNGTRCAAAFGLLQGVVSGPLISIATAAGPKTLRLIAREGNRFSFEMDMGLPAVEELRTTLHLAGKDFDATLLNVGNPQCAVFVPHLPEDWRVAAREAEGLERFPNRSNVSIVRVLDRHTIEAVFYERGAGETRSSGTGSTGAAAAAILRAEVDSPVEVRTPAGSMSLRWDDSVYLTGPAELIGEGKFFVDL